MFKQISADLKKYLDVDRTPEKCKERVQNLRSKENREKIKPKEISAFEPIYRSDGTNELDVPESLANMQSTTGLVILQETLLEIQELSEATQRRRQKEMMEARERYQTLQNALMQRHHLELMTALQTKRKTI